MPDREKVRVSAIVLAAGRSIRMGARNKLLLRRRGIPMLARVVRTAVSSRIDEVIVVLGHQASLARAALQGLDARIVVNHEYREGLASSIRTGVLHASDGTSGYLFCLSDQPHLEIPELNRLISTFEETVTSDRRAIVVPVYRGTRGNPALLSSSYRDQILGQKGDTGCRELIRRHPHHVVEEEMETDHVLTDINNDEDYRLWVEE